MTTRLAFIAAPALLLGSLLPVASPLLASANPRPDVAALRSSTAAATAPQTTVCEYANALVGVTLAFGFGAAGLDPSSGIPLSDGDTPQSVLDQLQQGVAALKALTPPAGWEDFHARYVAALEAFVNALPPAVAALNANDQQTAHDVVNAANQAFTTAGQALDQAFPDLQPQLDACN